MYKNFFGFNDRPFNLVPNPAYLFLSRTHEETLAHLTYAVMQGEGFMEITGEVGTGKTTLCRAFLENLDNDTRAAYIFNPNLNSLELLKAINDEFSIPSDADNAKDLIDTLNTFLMEQKAQGKKTILLIDEAQNLTNEVLEQLRLLSNLETSKHKLLCIILVGQPELKEKLNSHDLRQLKQRISLSCQLIPLSFNDARNYIQHRINVASERSEIQFADDAYRAIYKFSQGIPRLINIVCDRALLTAFGLDQKEITQKIVEASIKELNNESQINKNSLTKRKKVILLFSIFSIILCMIIYYHPGIFRIDKFLSSPEPKKVNSLYSVNDKNQIPTDTTTNSIRSVVDADIPVNKKPVTAATIAEAKKNVPDDTDAKLKKPFSIPISSGSKTSGIQKTKAFEPVIEPITTPIWSLGKILETMNRLSSRHMAIKVALNLWGIEPEIKPDVDIIDDDQNFFRHVSKEYDLLLRRINGSLNALKKLNLPVILAVHLKKDVPSVYLTLIKIDGRKVTLRGGKQDISIELSPVELESYWSGVAFIPWKNFLALEGTIPIDSPKDSIITLKRLLRDIGFQEVGLNPAFDDNTLQAIKKIQRKYGLHIDGAVGSTTKIALYNEKRDFKRPHIVSTAN